MKKYTPEELDAVLNAFFNEKQDSSKPDKAVIDILCADGYIAHDSIGNRTIYALTDKGKGFIWLGGYVAEAKRKKRDLIVRLIASVFASAVGAILGTMIVDLIYNVL